MSPCSINESQGKNVTVTKRYSGKCLTVSTVFLFCLALLAGLAVSDSAEAAKAKPQRKSTIGGYSSIVIDAATGKVLHEDNADAQKYPASLTKMMTLYMIFEALDAGKVTLGTTWKVSKHAESMSPTKLGLDAGETISVRDVILGLITQSANDAAAVAAEGLAGTEDRFGDLMTQRARRLGMSNTTFQNASGLPDPGQVTTARDMVRLSRALVRDFPHYYSYFSTPDFTYAGRRHANHNRLMNWYEGADGIKTGFIAASGFNLVASAKRDGRRVVAVVYGGTSVQARDNRMIQLLDTGFDKLENGDDRNAPLLMVDAPKRDQGLGLISNAEAATVAPTSAKAKQIKKATQAVAPRDTGTPNGEWAVQLGAFRQAAAAEKLLDRVKTKLPEAEPLVDAIDAGKSTLYRARLTGLTQTSARQACEQLKREKMTCAVISPDA